MSPLLLLLTVWLGASLPAQAFSALAHLAVVDSCWARGLVPALLARYPGATEAQLAEARSYAYGGALLQDLGYFPGNAPLFSDLTHYVRSGEFVDVLLAEARDRNELAFALGALSHYVADASGHPAATNAVTGLVFPELPAAPGTPLTYAQAPTQHSQVEFAFDVAELQAGRYRSEEFHAQIGLRVCRALLERSFRRTYGLPLGRVLPHVPEGLAAFRLVATQLLPAAVRASQYVPRARVRLLPLAEQQAYYLRVNSAHFRRAGRRADHLSLQMRLLVWLVPTLPRLGVARLLAFRPLPAAAETTMRAGFATALGRYSALLERLGEPLPDLNLDTGQPSRPADYPLADRTNAAWATRLAQARLQVPPPPPVPLTAALAGSAVR